MIAHVLAPLFVTTIPLNVPLQAAPIAVLDRQASWVYDPADLAGGDPVAPVVSDPIVSVVDDPVALVRAAEAVEEGGGPAQAEPGRLVAGEWVADEVK